MIQLDFLKYQPRLKLKTENNQKKVWDPVRSKWLVFTPEESVRQLLLIFLMEELRYQKNFIAIEKNIKVNSLTRRFDLLVYDKTQKPFLLVECKSPEIPVNQSAFHQIAWYNMPLKVPYLLVTNGLATYCCSMNYEQETFEFLDQIPLFDF